MCWIKLTVCLSVFECKFFIVGLLYCIVRSPPPDKSSPADNLPVKIRPARRLLGRDGFLQVNCRPRETFLGDGDPLMGHRPVDQIYARLVATVSAQLDRGITPNVTSPQRCFS